MLGVFADAQLELALAWAEGVRYVVDGLEPRQLVLQERGCGVQLFRVAGGQVDIDGISGAEERRGVGDLVGIGDGAGQLPPSPGDLVGVDGALFRGSQFDIHLAEV